MPMTPKNMARFLVANTLTDCQRFSIFQRCRFDKIADVEGSRLWSGGSPRSARNEIVFKDYVSRFG